MVRQFDVAALRHAIPPATRTRITTGIHTKSILNRRILQKQIRRMLKTRQSMMAAEMGIVAIPMQALRAAPATLDLHNTIRATTLARHLPPAAVPDHHQEAARLQVRIPHRLAPALPLPALRQTQAAVHPDQAPVLQQRQLRHRIQMQVHLDRQNEPLTLTRVEQCFRAARLPLQLAALFYTSFACRAKPSWSKNRLSLICASLTARTQINLSTFAFLPEKARIQSSSLFTAATGARNTI
jgi:hypothetical protein